VFGHGQDIGQHLCGVELVGEPVEHRYPGVFCQLLDDLLPRPAVLDRVVHAAEHTCGVLHRLFVTDLRGSGVDVGHVGTLVVRRDLERATRAGGGLLEDEGNILAGQAVSPVPRVLRVFQIAG
jgi:hypothetical protein